MATAVNARAKDTLDIGPCLDHVEDKLYFPGRHTQSGQHVDALDGVALLLWLLRVVISALTPTPAATSCRPAAVDMQFLPICRLYCL
jgi:hypothetical protein